MDDVQRLSIHPLTPDRFGDLEALFGPNGASSGCWCMWWRQSAADFERDAGAMNKRWLRELVEAGPEPGLLAYDTVGRPVGWVSVGPRTHFSRLNRSPKLKPVDEEPVWSVVCFYIARGRRGSGVAGALLAAAVDFAREHGASIVEGYPLDPDGGKISNASAFTGVLDLFTAAGFSEVERRGGRPIVRKLLPPRRAPRVSAAGPGSSPR